MFRILYKLKWNVIWSFISQLLVAMMLVKINIRHIRIINYLFKITYTAVKPKMHFEVFKNLIIMFANQNEDDKDS